MLGGSRKVLGLGSRLGVLVALLLVAGVGPAWAGTLRVQLGTSPAGCVASPWFATSMYGQSFCASWQSIFKYGDGWDLWPDSQSISAGAAGQWQINAPAGINIDSVTLPSITSSGLVSSGAYGWRAGDFWAGGTTTWGPRTTEASEGQNWPLNSSYYGFKLYCYASSCNNRGYLGVSEVDLTASENRGPSLIAIGSNNLWYQAGHYVWNAPGDTWPITLAASDPSGICNMWAYVNNHYLQGPSAAPNTSVWQQCPNPTWTPATGATVDTRDYVPRDGMLTLQLVASNAAGVSSYPSETLHVDNDPVRVSLSTPNDANPSVWVNHAVTIDAAASAGPSGIGGINCKTGAGAVKPYRAGGVRVNGDGLHTVACTAWNKAIDPEGKPDAGSSSTTVHIDEAPPALRFEPQNPSDPTGLVVDASDGESGVAGGQIEMRHAGGASWTPVATRFDGQRLLAHFDDAGLSGPYEFRATSCDNVGNCSSTSESQNLPVRLGSVSRVSFRQIKDPLVARVVRKRVRVGWHWVKIHRHGRVVRVRRGGHLRTIRVVRIRGRCTVERVKVAEHRWREREICDRPDVALDTHERVRFGRAVTVHGLLTTTQGMPIAGAQVRILTAPDDDSGGFTQAAGATTGKDGQWSAKLPAGPSRIIRADYDGAPTLLPASGQVSTTVAANVKLISVFPRRVAWGGTVRIVGQLDGGYLPPGGALVRLRIGSGASFMTYGVQEHVTGRGRFSTTYTFGAGVASVHESFWFSIASLPMGQYPYSPADSRRLSVLVGGHPTITTPARRLHQRHHRYQRRRRKR